MLIILGAFPVTAFAEIEQADWDVDETEAVGTAIGEYWPLAPQNKLVDRGTILFTSFSPAVAFAQTTGTDNSEVNKVEAEYKDGYYSFDFKNISK
ncbi:MAG: hypothetical protein GX326_07980 [Clostridiaceae bacterium]|nr:hypothetical protein [Clostridiaceae bacterium]